MRDQLVSLISANFVAAGNSGQCFEQSLSLLALLALLAVLAVLGLFFGQCRSQDSLHRLGTLQSLPTEKYDLGTSPAPNCARLSGAMDWAVGPSPSPSPSSPSGRPCIDCRHRPAKRLQVCHLPELQLLHQDWQNWPPRVSNPAWPGKTSRMWQMQCPRPGTFCTCRVPIMPFSGPNWTLLHSGREADGREAGPSPSSESMEPSRTGCIFPRGCICDICEKVRSWFGGRQGHRERSAVGERCRAVQSGAERCRAGATLEAMASCW